MTCFHHKGNVDDRAMVYNQDTQQRLYILGLNVVVEVNHLVGLEVELHLEDRLVGLVVKASASRAADLGSNPAFFRSSLTVT